MPTPTLPILVKHPVSGQQVNVAPLLVALWFDAKPTTTILPCACAGDVMRRAIRVLNKTVHDPNVTEPINLANLYTDLHQLEDAFDAVQGITD